MSGVPCRSSAASAGATAGEDDGLACDGRGDTGDLLAEHEHDDPGRRDQGHSRQDTRPRPGPPGDGARRVTSPSCRVGVVQVQHVVPEHGAAADRAGRAVDEDGEEVLADLLVRFPVGGVPGHASTVRPGAFLRVPRQPDGLGGRHIRTRCRAVGMRCGYVPFLACLPVPLGRILVAWEGDRADFFVSHAGADRAWAEWVAWQLIDAGYTVELDAWDWGGGPELRVGDE